jgi:hypothetical protein
LPKCEKNNLKRIFYRKLFKILKKITTKKGFELVSLDLKSPPMGRQIKTRIQNISTTLPVLLPFNVKSFLGC